MSLPLLTIVLPTRNRPELLRRSLAFYARYGLSYPIAIADSSDPDYHSAMDGLIGEFPKLSIHITRFAPDYNSWLKIIEVMEAQSSRYIGLSGDDDMLLNESLADCVDFLDNHPEVSVVDGREVRVALPNALLATQWFYSAVLHEQNEVVSPDPLSRLVQYFQSYWPTFYGVHRRESVIEAFRSGHEMETENLVSELMQGAITVLNGSYRCLPVPYIVRQVYHNQSTAFDSWGSIVESPDFPSLVAYFRDRVQAKFPDDPRVPAACDLAFDRFLETMLPEYDFKGSGVALDGGRAAQELAEVLALDNDSVREQARILTPPQLRVLAAQTRKPALASVAHMIATRPSGMTSTRTNSRGNLQADLSALPPALATLVARLCLDGFGPLLTGLLQHIAHTGGILTYQGISLQSGHNHYTLPVIPECILTIAMACQHDAISPCLTLIEGLEHPDIDMDKLLSFLSKPRSSCDALEKAAMALEKDPETLRTQLITQIKPNTELNEVERAGLLALFAACCSQAETYDKASAAYSAQLNPLHSRFRNSNIEICLLADMARVSFAALQGHLLVQHDWTALLESPAFQTPEGLFWAAEYGGTLLGTGQIRLAKTVLEKASEKRFMWGAAGKGQDPALERAGAQLLYHLALLRVTQDDPGKDAALEQAIQAIHNWYGSENWMLGALNARLSS